MAQADNPFAAPDDDRIAASSVPQPKEGEVEASFDGTGKSGERWRLAFTPDKLFFELEGREVGFAVTREVFADGVNIGALGGKRTVFIFKEPERHVITLPRAAFERTVEWLDAESRSAFVQRLLRSGWGSTLAVGLLFLVPTESDQLAQILAWAVGALLVGAGLLSRLSANPMGFLLRALGWGSLSALFVYGVVTEARSPWLLLVVFALVWGVLRYLRLFSYFRGR